MNIFHHTLRKRLLNIVHEDCQPLSGLCHILALDLADQTVPFTELALEMLGGAQTPELTVHHDHQSRAQRLAFLHAENSRTDVTEITHLDQHPKAYINFSA